MNTGRRETLIKLIHIAKAKARTCNCGRLSFKAICPACGKQTQRMPEFWYRSILEAMGGADTCAMIDTEGLQKVMDTFDKAGFTSLPKPKTKKRTEAQQLFLVRREAEKLLGLNWQDRINGYVWKKYGRDSVDQCTYEELRDVFGFVHRTAKYESRKAGKGA
ncbi:MAG: DUF1018 domain-containing protein [Spirochaetales bacterium]|nr:DUF1018 domain-containing protein [Spirochaetales bacterium]